MQEKQIEQKLVKKVKSLGGIAYKLTSSSYAGLPDRLILLPFGIIAFVEVKAKGKKPRALQLKRHKELSDLGFMVYVLDDENKIDNLINKIKGDEAL